jgi:putative peptide zinc metalloprotease protein
VPARHRAWLAGYAVASKLYLTLVLVTIVWSLLILLYPWHLQNVAYTIGCVALGGVLMGPLMGAVRLARNPVRRAELRQGRVALVGAVALAAAVVILAWPVKYYVRAPLVLLPADAARVYAAVAGTLTETLPQGKQVERGQTIARLQNTDVELELARLTGEHELKQMRLAHLEALRGLDPKANDEIPAARAELADVADRLAERQHDAARLTLSAPEAGTVIAAPLVHEAKPAGGRLSKWSGAILDSENRGTWVEPGTLVCLIGNPARLSAVLLVDDAEAQRVEPGQTVRMQLDELPGQVIEGTVVEVARRDAEATAAAASLRADLAPLLTGLVPAGSSATHYEVRVAFDTPTQKLVIGGRGEAKIAAQEVTLARRMLRWFSRTFRLPV